MLHKYLFSGAFLLFLTISSAFAETNESKEQKIEPRMEASNLSPEMRSMIDKLEEDIRQLKADQERLKQDMMRLKKDREQMQRMRGNQHGPMRQDSQPMMRQNHQPMQMDRQEPRNNMHTEEPQQPPQ